MNQCLALELLAMIHLINRHDTSGEMLVEMVKTCKITSIAEIKNNVSFEVMDSGSHSRLFL